MEADVAQGEAKRNGVDVWECWGWQWVATDLVKYLDNWTAREHAKKSC